MSKFFQHHPIQFKTPRTQSCTNSLVANLGVNYPNWVIGPFGCIFSIGVLTKTYFIQHELHGKKAKQPHCQIR